MKFGSICSGIEAASVAWKLLGWKAEWFAEIAKFPSAVLAHHYPETPNYGDFTKITPENANAIDLLVGGIPCQAFSSAGKRAGLADPRGNLTLEFLSLAGRFRPQWIVWENVPGVLSIDGGRTFGTILGRLEELGYGFAYRILDARHFGVAQGRRRLFVVGCYGDWRGAAAVLFDSTCLPGCASKVRSISNADSSVITRSTPKAVYRGRHGELRLRDTAYTLTKCNSGPEQATVFYDGVIRRFTPREQERLQGFPDDYTSISYRGRSARDEPRFNALGNSMPVPVMRWIGKRIKQVNRQLLIQEKQAA